jgi:hypothetical protein
MGYFAYRKLCRETLAIATTSIIQYHRYEKENGQRPRLEMWGDSWQRGYNWMWHGMMWEDYEDYNTRLSEERRTFDLYQALENDEKFRVGFGRCCKYAIVTLLKEIWNINTKCNLPPTNHQAKDIVARLIERLFELAGYIGTTNNTENSLIDNQIRGIYLMVHAIINPLDKKQLMNVSNILMEMGNNGVNLTDLGSSPEEVQERCAKITNSWNISFGWD